MHFPKDTGARSLTAVFFILSAIISFVPFGFSIAATSAQSGVAVPPVGSTPAQLSAALALALQEVEQLKLATETLATARSAGEGSASSPAPAGAPVGISIPSIALSAVVRGVGEDASGAMAVPSQAGIVGWFADGTAPGALGSAVLDAHVYLAFKNLKNVKTGDSIYVTGADGIQRRFTVSAVRTYADAAVPLRDIFTADDTAHLNLITCAGTWLPRRGTYSERLVVYATLAA